MNLFLFTQKHLVLPWHRGTGKYSRISKGRIVGMQFNVGTEKIHMQSPDLPVDIHIPFPVGFFVVVVKSMAILNSAKGRKWLRVITEYM